MTLLIQEPRRTLTWSWKSWQPWKSKGPKQANKKTAEPALPPQKTEQGAAEQSRDLLDNSTHSNTTNCSPSPTTPAKVDRAPRFPASIPTLWCLEGWAGQQDSSAFIPARRGGGISPAVPLGSLMRGEQGRQQGIRSPLHCGVSEV